MVNIPVLVIGLGRFGTALAETLGDLEHEVLGIDQDPQLVQRAMDRLTNLIEADATNLETMRQVGASDFKHAVVAVGTNIEASILATAVLVDLEVPNIWAKAITTAHGKILQRVGAHHVVFPEHDMGSRVAHLVSGRVLDYIQLDEGFTLVEAKPPTQLVGRTFGEAQVRTRFGVTVACIKPGGQAFTYATADTKSAPRTSWWWRAKGAMWRRSPHCDKHLDTEVQQRLGSPIAGPATPNRQIRGLVFSIHAVRPSAVGAAQVRC